MTFKSAVVHPLSRAMSRVTQVVRTTSDDRIGAATLARLRAEAAHPQTVWSPPTINGVLPRGVHEVSIGAFLVQYGGTPRRDGLLRPFAARVDALARKGVKEVYVGGSMTTDNPIPRDIDVLIGARSVRTLGMRGRLHDMAHGLNWHVAERRHTTFDPSWRGARPSWLEFFQFDRQMHPRGVVRIVLETPETALRGS